MAQLSLTYTIYSDLFTNYKRHFEFFKEYIKQTNQTEIPYLVFQRETDGRLTYSVGLRTFELRANLIADQKKARIVYSTVELVEDLHIVGQQSVIKIPSLDFTFTLSESDRRELTQNDFTSSYLRKVENYLYNQFTEGGIEIHN